jgi:hypothetical protein
MPSQIAQDFRHIPFIRLKGDGSIYFRFENGIEIALHSHRSLTGIRIALLNRILFYGAETLILVRPTLD